MINSHTRMVKETEGEGASIECGSRHSPAGTRPSPNRTKPTGRRAAMRSLASGLGQVLNEFWETWNRGPNTCPHSYHRTSLDFYKRIGKILASRRNEFISCAIVMIAQASCGINAFALLSSLQLPSHGGSLATSSKGSQLLWYRPDIWALVFGAVNCFFSFVTLFLTDRFGRTTLVLCGLPVMTALMVGLTVVFSNTTGIKQLNASWGLMLSYTAVYSFTLGPAAFSLPAESFPSSVRESGMALCVALNMLTLGLQILFYPIVSAHFPYWISLLIYTIINAVAFILVFLFSVDTKDR
jgi:hypothetical protein